jgi:cytochrome bd-type quinol oxidase subunit 2
MNRLTEYIKGTGWEKFIAVMSIVSGVLSVPIGILVIILGIYLWGTEKIATKLGAVLSIVVGIFVIPIGIGSIIAGIKLWRGAKNLENYKSTEKEEDLKEALKNLSDFFTWTGWMNVVGLAILVFVLIVILVLVLWYGSEILSSLRKG